MITLAVRFDFAAALVDDEARARRVGEILSQPCFRELERVSAHRGDRWVSHGKTAPEAIVSILSDRQNSAVSFETKRKRELVATGEIKSGIRETNEGATRFYGYLAFPMPDDLELTLTALMQLGDALDTGAGFIAAEPDHASAENVALGGAEPKPRPGLSRQQARERYGRDRHKWKRQSELAGLEWGTFLGAQHLARLDLANLRESGAFERIVEVSPRLVFLQLTADPADDLREDFDAKLQRAREALAPILMDVSDVKLD